MRMFSHLSIRFKLIAMICQGEIEMSPFLTK